MPLCGQVEEANASGGLRIAWLASMFIGVSALLAS